MIRRIHEPTILHRSLLLGEDDDLMSARFDVACEVKRIGEYGDGSDDNELGEPEIQLVVVVINDGTPLGTVIGAPLIPKVLEQALLRRADAWLTRDRVVEMFRDA